MKNSINIIIGIALFFILVGCNNISKNNNNPVVAKIEKITKENTAKDISFFIPDGWHILESRLGEPVKVEGDLNKDEITDVVVVIEKDGEGDLLAPRSLLIAFGNSDETFSLSIMADNAIMRAGEGGGWGDPFESISIDRGSVLIKFFGGSNVKWYYSYRFRYENGGWYMIGATLGSTVIIGDSVDFEEEDYNLLTGDYIFKKYDEQGKQCITKGNRGKKKLVNLKDFHVNSESTF
ncbi:MAG: hypothetical protein N4A57_08110 [Anaeromicrobium sp.]|jgi:hypothetical protein|uniref:hypothetical protein n=1 Tax=Anaeromicrobium sp. TaxID=1929132 RepID=UPI0025FEE100|nr:hypothetical protein [Anaeromicrobium sp.]MCT4594215.1 hypothetical protein [Anaeromicrobium sp.]